VNKHNVDVNEVRIVPSNDVVGDHKASKLVNVEVSIGKRDGVRLVLKEENASKDVSAYSEG